METFMAVVLVAVMLLCLGLCAAATAALFWQFYTAFGVCFAGAAACVTAIRTSQYFYQKSHR